MPKKYKHIDLPKRMLSAESTHVSSQPPFFQKLDSFDKAAHKIKLTARSEELVSNIEIVTNKRVFPEDKNASEMELIFRGYPDNGFIKKYGINVYQKLDKTVIGKIHNVKLPGQTQSDFERLRGDINQYSKTNELSSYFEKIEDIRPLKLDDVLDQELKAWYEKNPDKDITIDISFADNKNISEQKLQLIKKEYSKKFVSSVNTDLVHFCRIVAKYSDIQKTVEEFGGISYVEAAPNFELLASAADIQIKKLTIVPHDRVAPVLIFDQPISNHNLLNGAVIQHIGSTGGDNRHGTSVASLVVYGLQIHPSATLKQDNTVIGINIYDGHKQEETIEKTIKDLSTKFPLLIANLSTNTYSPLYLRKRVDKFTVLLDDLASKYNCLFFISAGNIRELFSNTAVSRYCIREGYPNYFKEPFSYLLPPADSINNVSVGSVAYQQSPMSAVQIGNPTPFTRINFPDNCFIKPDFVHYDANVRINSTEFVSEENGVMCASEHQDKLTSRIGTSFAAPLIAHDAGILHNTYPRYTASTIRALLTHFADGVDATQVANIDFRNRLVGFGKPNLTKTLYSLSNSATIVIEDSISLNKTKRIKLPIPQCIKGDYRKRLRVKLTLAYNPVVNPKDVNRYNPVNVSVRLIRPDGKDMNSSTTRSRLTEAYSKSNIKKYSPIERSTKEYCGRAWTLQVVCEGKPDELPTGYQQNYSLIATIEDIKQDEDIDLYEEIVQMIEIESHIEIPVEVITT